MKITNNFELIAKKDGSIISIIDYNSAKETDPNRVADCCDIYNTARFIDEADRENWLAQQIKMGKYSALFPNGYITVAEKMKERLGVMKEFCTANGFTNKDLSLYSDCKHTQED